MKPVGILSVAVYCLFLAGAAKSFRENGSSASVRIMLAGVVLDMLLSCLPLLGVQGFGTHSGQMNSLLAFAIVSGFCVWIAFFTALGARWKGRFRLYHSLITVCEIGWFVSFVAFLYGMDTRA